LKIVDNQLALSDNSETQLRGLTSLSEAVASSTVSVLALCRCGLNAVGAQLVAKALETTRTLSELNISGCGLRAAGARSFEGWARSGT
jgi:hypothetical protein